MCGAIWKGNMRKKNNTIDISEMKWSQPMCIKGLSQIFDVHRNTMSKWLKDQVVCNRQLSPRKWEVAAFELPNDLAPNNFVN
jgi:hypothetical protein